MNGAVQKWNSRKLAGALGTVLTMIFGLSKKQQQ